MSDGDAPRQPDHQDRQPFYRSGKFWLIMALVVAAYLVALGVINSRNQRSPAHISYSTFQQQVESNNVASVTSHGSEIDGQTRRPVADMSDPRKASRSFSTMVPQFAGGNLEALLQQHHVNVAAESSDQGSMPLTLLASFGPVILLIVAFVWLFRRQMSSLGGGGAGNMFGFGQSKARVYDAQRPETTFSDVAGIEEVKDELRELVDFLKRPGIYRRLGGSMPKGVLLVGPPGAGKTLIAKAVAGEAGVPFFSVSASEFVEMIVGVGASRTRDLFQKAREAAPAIVFIDELDAIGRKRASGLNIGGHNEQEQTLNQILTEMDGFDSREGVTVLAATNRADVLDEALLRPGRFDRQIAVHPPDRAGRAAILRIHARNMPLDPAADLELMAAETPGLVGSDLRNLVNEAAILAAARGHEAVTIDDFQDALKKIMLGRERHIALSRKDREKIAYHEGGHALVALLTPNSDPVRLVSILPRGQALGVTLQAPVDDRLNYSEDYLRARLTSSLGGRAAEQLVYGVVTTGAENDLRLVSQLARDMVTRWGMSQRLGAFTTAREAGTPQREEWSQATAEVIDREVQHIIDEAYEWAQRILAEHRSQLDDLAAALTREETLDQAAVLSITRIETPAECPRPHGADTGRAEPRGQP